MTIILFVPSTQACNRDDGSSQAKTAVEHTKWKQDPSSKLTTSDRLINLNIEFLDSDLVEVAWDEEGEGRYTDCRNDIKQ